MNPHIVWQNYKVAPAPPNVPTENSARTQYLPWCDEGGAYQARRSIPTLLCHRSDGYG